MKKTTLTFTHERETKNMQRYNEDVVGNAKPTIGALYIRSDVAGAGEAVKKTVTVTIE